MKSQNINNQNKNRSNVGASEQRTLLLMDNDDNILSVLENLLIQSGYQVLTANNGSAGLMLLEQHEIGVVISNQLMVDMTGGEFLSKVKQHNPKIVRLMLSGFTDFESMTTIINEAAIYRFIPKPCDNELLLSNVEEAFRHFETLRDNDLLQQELQSSNRALGDALNEVKHKEQVNTDYFASMSFALRTPLNGVLGMTELLKGTTLDTQQRNNLEIIASSGQQLLTLITDMLDISKAEAGKQTLETIDFDVQEFIEGLDQFPGTEARDKGLLFDTHFKSSKSLMVRGDLTRLRQALIILLNNAIKFTTEGEVCLNVLPIEMTDDEVCLLFEVKDTGVGMDAATQCSLLDYFTQTESKVHVYEGDGQDLKICKELVQAMGGEMELSSAPGRGSTFWFSIRLAKTSACTDIISNMPRYSGRVLVVEDNLVDQLVVSGFLGAYGLEVEKVSNGKLALEVLSRKKYDMVFMDCNMPGVDGYEITQDIRTNDTYLIQKNTPIIALTGKAMKGDRERCLQAGMDGYIIKPVNRQVLQTVLTRWLPNRNKPKLTLVPTPPGHSKE